MLPNGFRLLFFTCLIVSCNSYDPTLFLINKSSNDIYAEYSRDSLLTEINIFREGYHFDKRRNDSIYIKSENFFKIDSGKYFLKKYKYQWINFVESCPDSTFYIFIVLDKVAKSYTNEQIVEKGMFEARLMITLQDLEENNWTITYTGVK